MQTNILNWDKIIITWAETTEQINNIVDSLTWENKILVCDILATTLQQGTKI